MAWARAARLEERHDVAISWMPYELHPEIPDGGQINNRKFRAIAKLADDLELPFLAPKKFRPTRRAHQAVLLMDHIDPANTRLLMDRLFEAIWVKELDIESPQVLSELIADSEMPTDLLQRVVLSDELKPAISVSVNKALEWGITGTPSWVIDNKLMVPGLQEDDFFDRVITKLAANRAEIREP